MRSALTTMRRLSTTPRSSQQSSCWCAPRFHILIMISVLRSLLLSLCLRGNTGHTLTCVNDGVICIIDNNCVQVTGKGVGGVCRAIVPAPAASVASHCAASAASCFQWANISWCYFCLCCRPISSGVISGVEAGDEIEAEVDAEAIGFGINPLTNVFANISEIVSMSGTDV